VIEHLWLRFQTYGFPTDDEEWKEGESTPNQSPLHHVEIENAPYFNRYPYENTQYFNRYDDEILQFETEDGVPAFENIGMEAEQRPPPFDDDDI